jgi:hypothetical protein
VQAADKNYYLATSVTRVDDIEHTSLRYLKRELGIELSKVPYVL